MQDFQAYQQAFTAHIRDPTSNKKPADVNEERLAVYREAVFNNIFEAASGCFPVSQTVLGKREWQKLMRQFLAHHQANTPIFREIPQELLKFMQSDTDLATYMVQLAHYEWVELAVNMQQAPEPSLSSPIDLLNEKPQIAGAHMLLEYDYPVHKISAKFKPKKPEKTYLLVFRNSEFIVKFIELNPVTYLLLNIIEENKLSGKQVLARLAKEIEHPNIDAMTTFGLEILTDLAVQQAIVGSIKK
ncbi:MAG: HvfC family RiPP maturation protein [Methylophilaceae bacterium]